MIHQFLNFKIMIRKFILNFMMILEFLNIMIAILITYFCDSIFDQIHFLILKTSMKTYLKEFDLIMSVMLLESCNIN